MGLRAKAGGSRKICIVGNGVLINRGTTFQNVTTVVTSFNLSKRDYCNISLQDGPETTVSIQPTQNCRVFGAQSILNPMSPGRPFRGIRGTQFLLAAD